MSREMHLHETFRRAWAGRDPFAAVAALQGPVYRAQQSRRTLRFELEGESYFLKHHGGTGWGEIFKNLLSGRLPVVGARNEWRALRRLRELGVDTLEPVAYGRRGWLPSRLESFLITRDLGEVESLEDVCATWPEHPPGFADRLFLTRRLADTARLMHGSGLCHRDFYLCHFLRSRQQPERLFLIDLHRALLKRRLGRRWLVKDLGSLWFSAMEIGLTQRDLLRFARLYSGQPLRRTLTEDRRFWNAVSQRAQALKRKHG